MRASPTLAVAFASCLFAAAGPACAFPGDPEPKTIAGKCNKEVGGYYDPARKAWVLSGRLVAAKNACVTRMLKYGR